MQRSVKEPDGSGQPMRIADLRASLRAGSATDPAARTPRPPKPPKPRKAVAYETEEERALKAEKQALAQHRTSLLKGGDSRKPYVRPGEKLERRKGTMSGFLFQLALVLTVAGGVAYALDPTIVPAEWQQKAYEFVSQYVKI